MEVPLMHWWTKQTNREEWDHVIEGWNRAQDVARAERQRTEDQNFQRLGRDYDQTNQNFRMLADIRFKLLTLVPAATAAAISIFGKQSSTDRPDRGIAFAVGLLGFCEIG